MTVLDSDYPESKLKILIGSDGSTDRSNDILKQLALEYSCVESYVYPVRRGKAAVLNELVRQTEDEILVFTDANVMFDNLTLKELVYAFSDVEVGCACSRVLNTGQNTDEVFIQEQAYISRENDIKFAEGLLGGNTIAPFGACYAIRSTLYTLIPENFLVDDFFISTSVLNQKFKSVMVARSIVYEDLPGKMNQEYRRKVRIATGNFQNLFYFRKFLFNPFLKVSVFFFFHKLIRWLSPLLLACILFSNLALINLSIWFKVLFIIQCLIYCIALMDLTLSKMQQQNKLIRFVSYFLSTNVALIQGFFNWITGNLNPTWTPVQRKS